MAVRPHAQPQSPTHCRVMWVGETKRPRRIKKLKKSVRNRSLSHLHARTLTRVQDITAPWTLTLTTKTQDVFDEPHVCVNRPWTQPLLDNIYEKIAASHCLPFGLPSVSKRDLLFFSPSPGETVSLVVTFDRQGVAGVSVFHYRRLTTGLT